MLLSFCDRCGKSCSLFHKLTFKEPVGSDIIYFDLCMECAKELMSSMIENKNKIYERLGKNED